MEQIYVQQFVSIKEATRNKIREVFDIKRSSHAEVITDSMGMGIVVCDGTTNEDLKELTIEKMRDFLGSIPVNETITGLLKQVVDKIEEVNVVTPTILEKPQEQPISLEPQAQTSTLETNPTNLNPTYKCPDCEYTNASKQGLRMHIYKKHTKK